MMKLNLVNGKTADESAGAENGTAAYGGMNHETKLIKYLVDPWVGK